MITNTLFRSRPVEPTVSQTDLDRLHKVALGEINERGCGKTYLACHELCSVVEIGQVNHILAKIKYHRDITFILPMLTEVMQERGIVNRGYLTAQNRLTANDVRVWFIPENKFELESQKFGITAGFVDFVDY